MATLTSQEKDKIHQSILALEMENAELQHRLLAFEQQLAESEQNHAQMCVFNVVLFFNIFICNNRLYII